MNNSVVDVLGAVGSITKTWKQALITLVFLGLLGGGLLGYQFASAWIQEYVHYQDIVDRLEMDDTVQVAVDNFRSLNDAERIVIGELHDGKTNMSGVRFGYVSATYESTAAGIAPMVMEMQNLPTSMFAGYWANLINGECVTLSRGDQSVTPTMDSFMEGNGSKTLMICPIHRPGQRDMLIGLGISMWMEKIADKLLPAYLDNTEDMALVVSGSVTGRK